MASLDARSFADRQFRQGPQASAFRARPVSQGKAEPWPRNSSPALSQSCRRSLS